LSNLGAIFRNSGKNCNRKAGAVESEDNSERSSASQAGNVANPNRRVKQL
jgi:hypothetical protein